MLRVTFVCKCKIAKDGGEALREEAAEHIYEIRSTRQQNGIRISVCRGWALSGGVAASWALAGTWRTGRRTVGGDPARLSSQSGGVFRRPEMPLWEHETDETGIF